MKTGFGQFLTRVGNWIVDLGSTIREVGAAVAYARAHPTELPKHDQE